MKVSVVIVANRAKDTIRHTLDSLRKQTRKPDEVFVIVPSTDDNTLEVLKEYSEVQVIVSGQATRGFQRAVGVQYTSEDIIAFIDADCVAHPKWLEALKDLYSRGDIMVLGGLILGVRDLRRPHQHDTSELKDSSPGHVKFLPTANFSFRREVLNMIGNFNGKLHEGEDLDFCIRLRKAGYEIYYNPNAKVYHLAHGSGLRRAWRDGRSRAQALTKHGSIMLGDAFIVFFHVTSLLTSATLLAAGYPKLAFLVLIPSVMHRLYRALISVKQGNTVLASLLNSFTTYISHISFATSLPSLTLKRIWKCKPSR